MISASQRLAGVTRVFDPYQDRTDFVRLDRNEDPIGWDESHLSEWFRSLTAHDLAAYADSTALVNKLAAWLGVKSDNIYVTAGSDAAIKNIFEVYIDPGDRILLQSPGWRMYEVYANVYGANQVMIPYRQDLTLDTQRIFSELRNTSTRMLILANPNQPTGTLINANELSELIEEAKRQDVIVVVDEAYHLFTPQTALLSIFESENVIVVRTFSKAFGLAGLRIGFCIAAVPRIRELMLLRPVTDANSLALKCAEYLVDNRNWISERIADTIAGRDYLLQEMQKSRVATYPSHANFLLIRCASLNSGYEAIAEIRKRGYLIKGPFGFAPLENCIRISVGPLELMKAFWAECKDVLQACTAFDFITG